VTTTLVTHPACIGHAPPPGHPESPERLKSVLAALEGEEFAALKRHEAPQVTDRALMRVHGATYVAAVKDNMPESGYVQFDADTIASPGTGEAILRAAGAVNAAADLVMAGETTNAFCAVRPPGHHALSDRAMGFCFFNSVAVGAEHVRAIHNLQRVAVVDFDVHHGNGTQAMFYAQPGLFYASTHQSPHYPGTGRPEERGVANNVLNVPLRPGAGSVEFRRAFTDQILPALEGFHPEFIFISAGFDAHENDPLGNLKLHEDDYAWATERICALAAQACEGRVVSSLEGGYDLAALGLSAAAHVRALMAAEGSRISHGG
jgi:acetoin utilization deacetylase AcuC-like enzyme